MQRSPVAFVQNEIHLFKSAWWQSCKLLFLIVHMYMQMWDEDVKITSIQMYGHYVACTCNMMAWVWALASAHAYTHQYVRRECIPRICTCPTILLKTEVLLCLCETLRKISVHSSECAWFAIKEIGPSFKIKSAVFSQYLLYPGMFEWQQDILLF